MDIRSIIYVQAHNLRGFSGIAYLRYHRCALNCVLCRFAALFNKLALVDAKSNKMFPIACPNLTWVCGGFFFLPPLCVLSC